MHTYPAGLTTEYFHMGSGFQQRVKGRGVPALSPWHLGRVDIWQGSSRELIFVSNPLESAFQQLHEAPLDAHSTLIHLVRRPSDLVVSGYRYHKQVHLGREKWLRYKFPRVPDCFNCDHWAWLRIFDGCDYRCSYQEALKNSSLAGGLVKEVLRSRWDVLKMLRRARRWQHNKRVLQLRLDSFDVNFDETLRCLLRFILTDAATGEVDAMVQRAQELGLDAATVRRRCEAGACGEVFVDSWAHMTSLDDRRILRAELRKLDEWDDFIAPADALLKSILQSGSAATLYGCPRLEE